MAAQKKDCVTYKLLGECQYGDKCKRAHHKASRVFTTYIQLPKGLSLGSAIGREGSNLRPIMAAVEFRMRPSKRAEGEVEVVAASEDNLSNAEGKLKTLFAQIYPLGPKWCYLQTEGLADIATKMQLEFKVYRGRTQLFWGQRKRPMYEVCCCEKSAMGHSESAHDTSLEELKKLNPTSSPLDSVDELHKALDIMHSGAVSSPDKVGKTGGPTAQARIMIEYKEDIRGHLQSALEWALKNQVPNHMLKLEARFGKVLWFRLPDDVTASDEPWGVEQFAEFVFTDTIHSKLFSTDVRKENAQNLYEDSKPTLETLDIKFTITSDLDPDRHKLDLRLKIEGGKLEVILLKQNEIKLMTFDVLCLHRNHDIRVGLHRFEVVTQTYELYSTVDRLLQNLTIPKPGLLEFTPCTDDWTVEFIRHKKRTAYVIDNKCMVTITAIQEYRTDWEKLLKGQAVTVNFNDISEHFEVELHNILWECTFGKDVGFPPEKALALHTEHPAVTPQLAASIPHPWGVQDILQDYDEFLDYLDQLNESLGMVV